MEVYIKKVLNVCKVFLLFVLFFIVVYFLKCNKIEIKEESKKLNIQEKIVEKLERGVVAVSTSEGVLVTWRSFGTESNDTVYKLFRNSECIYISESGMATCYLDKEGNLESRYSVQVETGEMSESVNVYANNYLDIDIQKPNMGETPPGEKYTYFPGDASCGDLDGDGEYEIILKWDPSNEKDNSQYGYTGNVLLDAYKLDGTMLWRIDLGVNIRAGSHYTPFLVYDFDENGMAEIVCKTSDGTVDGTGKIIGIADADYRNMNGLIIYGNEYITVFDGITGAEVTTIEYDPLRENVNVWGDNYGNRSERFLAAVAYLDGKKPSLVICRGCYTRIVLVAYNFDGTKLYKKWKFDSSKKINIDYSGQGNHNLCVADVDGDGCDEIVYGQCCIDDNGTGLWTLKLGHGDMINVGDFWPEREGLEIWGCLEINKGAYLADAKTGEILYRYNSEVDIGRAIADNFIPGNNLAEFYCSSEENIQQYVNGNIELAVNVEVINFSIWWTGNLEKCSLNDISIYKYDGDLVFKGEDVKSINGTKQTPCLIADILGDWREEVIYPKTDGTGLRIYISDYKTNYRLYTLMHNSMYRCGVANENVGYNISPKTNFFLGIEQDLPEYPKVVYSK